MIWTANMAVAPSPLNLGGSTTAGFRLLALLKLNILLQYSCIVKYLSLSLSSCCLCWWLPVCRLSVVLVVDRTGFLVPAWRSPFREITFPSQKSRFFFLWKICTYLKYLFSFNLDYL
jgi:hypothetical protein